MTTVNVPKNRMKAIRAQREHARSSSNRSSNFLFMATSKRKPRQLKEGNWRGRGEKLLIFNVGVDVFINRFYCQITDGIQRILFEERFNFLLSFSG